MKLTRATVNDFRQCWKRMMLTDIVCKLIIFVFLAPLLTVPMRLAIALSSKTVLADQDILHFFLSPVGWICFLAMGALWIGIMAFELTALLAILAANKPQHIGPVAAIRFAVVNKWRILRVTNKMVATLVLVSAPFLVTLGLVYYLLLSGHDINFYLQEKPPVFLLALGLGAVIGLAWTAVVVRFFANWFFAFPLVVFENVNPSVALRESSARAVGHRRRIAWWIVVWWIASFALSAVATGIVTAIARFFIPNVAGSLSVLTIAIGVGLLAWLVVNLIVNVVSQTMFASLYFNLYRQVAQDTDVFSADALFGSSGQDNWKIRVTRRRLVIGMVVSLLAAIGLGVLMLSSLQTDDRVYIIAHRGSSMAAPENTMAAVRQAIEDGADWIEIDVQETADGHVVVFHDSDFMKLAGNNLKIQDATMDDLKNIDIGSSFAAEFSNERVPTLEQVLVECKGKARVCIELKYYGHDMDLEKRVADIVDAHEMASEIVVMSLKLDAVKKMKTLRPEWKVGFLMSVSTGNVKAIEADFLAVNASFAERSFIKSVQRSGKEICVWTVNDAATMSTMIGRGVDGLITDVPALARSVLQQRAKLTVAERLMIELAEVFGVVPEIVEQ